MSDDNILYPDFPVRAGELGGGGDGPHNPGMEQRVATLEVDMKEVKGSLKALELSSARVEALLENVPTKADLATLNGRVDTLSAKVDKVERDVSTALTAAIGKAIGPGQLFGMLASLAALIGAGAAFIAWLIKQPWFLK